MHAYLSDTVETDADGTTTKVTPPPRLLQLQTPPLAVKFTGPLGAVACALRDLRNRGAHPDTKGLTQPELATFVASPAQYARAIRAMLAHGSQLVWFRWLYISFSHLMWANQLIEVV